MSDPDSEFKAGDALATIFLALLIVIGLSSLLSRTAMMFASLAFPLAALIVVVLRGKPMAAVFAPGRVTPPLFGWTLLGSAGLLTGVMSLVDLVLKALPHDYKRELEELEKVLLELPVGVLLILSIVMAPLCEEVFFRGAVLRGIRSTWGTVVGLLLSSALFAAWHIMPPRMIVTFVLGLWFGWLTVATGGLGMSIVAHMFNNAAVVVLSIVGIDRLPTWAVLPGGLAVAASAWRIRRSMQGSAPSLPS